MIRIQNIGRWGRAAVLLLAIAVTTVGCFKKETTDTTLVIKSLVEPESGAERTAAPDVYGYIYYTENEDWTISSYEDAAAKIITHPLTNEQLTTPDVESEPYIMEGSQNSYISLFQSGAPALVVVVYPESRMYAYMYRKAEAINLTHTYLTLIFHPWKDKPYTEGSKDGYRWNVVPYPATDTPTEQVPTE